MRSKRNKLVLSLLTFSMLISNLNFTVSTYADTKSEMQYEEDVLEDDVDYINMPITDEAGIDFLYGQHKSEDKPDYQLYGSEFDKYSNVRSFSFKDTSPVKVEAQSINSSSSNLTISGYVGDMYTRLDTDASAITSRLDEINDTIKKAQHKYKVGYLYSKNNEIPNALWRPKLEEIPEVLSYAYWDKGYASIYEGFWNLGVTPNDEKSNIMTLGIKDTDENMETISRATKILGNDIILKYDALTYKPEDLDNTGDYTYSQEYIDKDEVTYSDAVQVLYKALGQKQIWAAISTKPDPSITPATSPLSKYLSNVTSFNVSEGACSVFVSRSGKIVERAYQQKIKQKLGKGKGNLKTGNWIRKWSYDTEFQDFYWEKALKDGLVYDGIYPYNDMVNGARVFNVNWKALAKLRKKINDEKQMNNSDRYNEDSEENDADEEDYEELSVDKKGNEAKAYNGQYGDAITGMELIKLTADMMNLYGEPVMNKQEEQALLQVYGAEYPVQLPRSYAKAWAYLKARGVLNVDLEFDGTVTREQLLDIALCVGDKDSRTDFKKIVPTIEISQDMMNKGYYPNDKFKVSNEKIETDVTVSYEGTDYWDYLIPVDYQIELTEDNYDSVFTEDFNSVITTGPALKTQRNRFLYKDVKDYNNNYNGVVNGIDWDMKERMFGPNKFNKPGALAGGYIPFDEHTGLPQETITVTKGRGRKKRVVSQGARKSQTTAPENYNKGKTYTYSTTFRDWETKGKTNSFYIEANPDNYGNYIDKFRKIVGYKYNPSYKYKAGDKDTDKDNFTAKLRWLKSSYEGKVVGKDGKEYYHYMVSKDYNEYGNYVQLNTDDPDDVPSFILLPKGGGVYTEFKISKHKNPGSKYGNSLVPEPYYPDEGRIYGSTFMYATKEGHYSFNKFNDKDWTYYVDAIRSEGYGEEGKKSQDTVEQYLFDSATRLETDWEANEDQIQQDIKVPEKTDASIFDIFKPIRVYAAQTTGKTVKATNGKKKGKLKKVKNSKKQTARASTIFTISNTTDNCTETEDVDKKYFNPLARVLAVSSTNNVPEYKSGNGSIVKGIYPVPTKGITKSGNVEKDLGGGNFINSYAKPSPDPLMDFIKGVRPNGNAEKRSKDKKAFIELMLALQGNDLYQYFKGNENNQSLTDNACKQAAEHIKGALTTAKASSKVSFDGNDNNTKTLLKKIAMLSSILDQSSFSDNNDKKKVIGAYYDILKSTGWDASAVTIDSNESGDPAKPPIFYKNLNLRGSTLKLNEFISKMNKVANSIQANNAASNSSSNSTDPATSTTVTSNEPSTEPIKSPTGLAKKDIASIGTTVITSVIMNKNKNIMVSWDSLVQAGIVPALEDNRQPEPNPLDGIFYLQTNKGVVKVNQESGTVMVGNTFYNFGTSDDSESNNVILVYNHKDKLYFDIRCFTGITKKDVVPNATKEIKISNQSTGVGVDAVYDLDIANLYDVYDDTDKQDTYVVPFGISAKDNSLIKHYPSLTLMKETKYDGQHFLNQQVISGSGKKKTYWSNYVKKGGGTLDSRANQEKFSKALKQGKSFAEAKALVSSDTGAKKEWFDGKSNSYRISLNDLNPTANYVVVIDAKSSIPKAKLFVWYPRTAFINATARSNGKKKGIYDMYGWRKKDNQHGYTLFKSKVEHNYHNLDFLDKLKTYGKSFISQVSNTGYDVEKAKSGANKVKSWVDAMTLESAGYLYDMTNGGMWLDKNYAIRSFEITNNSPVLVNTYTAGSKVDTKAINGNSNSTIYWLDGIGYVYNVPRDEIYKQEDYLSGQKPLPLSYDVQNKKFIDYNIDSIGKWNTTKVQLGGYGWVPRDNDVVNVFADYKSRKLINSGKVPTNGSVYIVKNTDAQWNNSGIRYGLDPEADSFIEAPMGAYVHMGGLNNSFITGEEAMSAMLSANTVYWGHYPIIASDIGSRTVHRGNNVLDTFEPNVNSRFYKIYDSQKGRDFYISVKGTGTTSASVGNKELKYEDGQTNDFLEYFNNITLKGILDTIDAGASYIILIALFVIPGFMLMVMTVLIGLSFITDSRVFQMFCERFFDPIKILTLGYADVNTWHWRTVLIPCLLLWCSFALVLNGNIFRLVQWAVQWFLVIRDLIKNTF